MSGERENKLVAIPLLLFVASAILWFFQAFMLINAQPFPSSHTQMVSVSICVVGIILSAVLTSSKSNKINRRIFIEKWILVGLAISFLPALYVIFRSSYVLFALSGVIGIFFGLGAPVLLGYFAFATKDNYRSTISGAAFLIIIFSFNLFSLISSTFIELIILFSLMLIAFLSFRIIKPPKVHSDNQDLSWRMIPADKPFLLYLLSMLILMLGIFLVMPTNLVLFASKNDENTFLIMGTVGGSSAIICGYLGDLFGRKKLLFFGFFLAALSYSILSIFPLATFSYYIYLILYSSSLGILYPIFIFTLWGDLSKRKSPEKYYTLGCLPFIIAVALEYSIGPSMVGFLSQTGLSSFVGIFLFAAILPLAYAAEILPSQYKIDELNSERQRLLNMLENLPAMVCLITADHRVAFANRVFREKYGESEGKPCYTYFEGKERPCEFCEAFQVLKTHKPHHWVVNTQDGSVIDAYDYPFTDVDGSSMVLEVNIDITDRKNLEKQLQEKERLAAIGATAGMVGHDIRNPLQSIIGDVFLLRNGLTAMPKSETKQEVEENLESIENNVEYINKIVADLQDYARPLTPSYRKVGFSDLFTQVLRTIKVPDNIMLSVNAKGSFEFETDVEFVRRALTNLIINSIQAMPKGGKLDVGGFEAQDKVYITVSDTGEGIPEEVKPKLFTPMMTTKAKGQGLGLAVVKRLVEALDGRITFESEEGKGTKFMIELPLTVNSEN